MDVTTLVAVYAALVSTGMLMWTVHAGRRDNARIRLKVLWAHIYQYGQEPAGPYFSFDVVNAGRRSITIQSFGFKLTSKLISQINPLEWSDLPFDLLEGKNKSLLALPEKVAEGLREQVKSPPKHAYIRDATGKFYMCRVPQNIRDRLWGDASYRPWWRLWEQSWWPL